MNIQTIKVASTDGTHTLYGKVYVPDGPIVAQLQVVHGMNEHIERYRDFMTSAANHGILCFAHDQLGHGNTAREESELGFIAHRNGYQLLQDDITAVAKSVNAQYGKAPRILFGHSMGSFTVRLYAAKHGGELDGLIICGTGGKNPAADIGLVLTRMISAICGEKHRSPLLHAMAFGTYPKHFPEKSIYNWLSRDPEISRAYAADKFCTFLFTVSAMNDLIRLNRDANCHPAFAGLPKDLPILLISGEKDPVGDFGKGFSEVSRKLEKAGLTDFSAKLYPGARHELLNELCKNEVTDDILNFCLRTANKSPLQVAF